jgi:hypothetical protein
MSSADEIDGNAQGNFLYAIIIYFGFNVRVFRQLKGLLRESGMSALLSLRFRPLGFGVAAGDLVVRWDYTR